MSVSERRAAWTYRCCRHLGVAVLAACQGAPLLAFGLVPVVTDLVVATRAPEVERAVVGVDSLSRFLVAWPGAPTTGVPQGRLILHEARFLGPAFPIEPWCNSAEDLSVSSSWQWPSFVIGSTCPSGQPAPGGSVCAIRSQRLTSWGELGSEVSLTTHPPELCPRLGSVQILPDGSQVAVYDRPREDRPSYRGLLFDRLRPTGELDAAVPLLMATGPSGASHRAPALSVSEGGAALAWISHWGNHDDGNCVSVRLVDEDMQLQHHPTEAVSCPESGDVSPPSVGIDAAGSVAVAWAEPGDLWDPEVGFLEWRVRGYVEGDPIGTRVEIDLSRSNRKPEPALAMDGAGNWVVAWRRDAADGSSSIVARAFDAAAQPLGDEVIVSRHFIPVPGTQPSVAMAPNGAVAVAWTAMWSGEPVVAAGILRLTVTRACEPSPTTLCVTGGRFAVTMQYRTTTGVQSPAFVVPDARAEDSGLFWFFSEANWEALVKVLDGCWYNGHFWVFFTAASDVEMWVTVTDTSSGEQWTLHREAGEVTTPITDTRAFACGL